MNAFDTLGEKTPRLTVEATYGKRQGRYRFPAAV
jgi:hypothetical protein